MENKNTNKHITVFEHQSIKIGNTYGTTEFTSSHKKALEQFYGTKGVPYFSLINKGVKFNKFVGVIKVGLLTIEILPKADKDDKDNEKLWRDTLIGMLRSVNLFNIHAPSSSSLNLKANSILDLYFEIFIKEVEYLFNKGLIKKYRKTEGNSLALKGNLLFSKHIQHNLVHQERFYIKHTVYDKQHIIHILLYKTLFLLKRINTNVALKSRIGSLLLNFPEMKDIKVTDATFNRVVINRKSKDYINALEISRLLLLNYHPDLSSGKNNVLALMFDMNMLWEKFIYVSLRKHLPAGVSITAQTKKCFWESESGKSSTIRPDIVINKGEDNAVVLDTKWKNIGDRNPSAIDLRQLYVYHKYYKAKKGGLVYPGSNSIISEGHYCDIDDNSTSKEECSVINIQSVEEIKDWQIKIGTTIYNEWIK